MNCNFNDKNDEMIVGIYLVCAWVCEHMGAYVKSHAPHKAKKKTRTPAITYAEIMTILIYYPYSGYKCFKYYYLDFVCTTLSGHFMNLPSYARFVELIERVQAPMMFMSKLLCCKSNQTGIYFIDASTIKVCHIKREGSHKVFKGLCSKGKSSMGWFFGFKIHLVINEIGEIINFSFTEGAVSDNNTYLLSKMLCHLKGLCFGDKGYITSLFEELYCSGIKMVTNIRKNMKNKLMVLKEKVLLKKRGVIESCFAVMKRQLDLEHTRHRKAENGIVHMFSTIVAYHFYPNKPKIQMENLT